MRVTLDETKCQAYGNCMLTAPDVFDLGDEDAFVRILQERPAPELRAVVEEAVRSCPVEALTLHED
jgi:ferredoxin